MTLDEQYEEWMFERFAGACCKDAIIEMCENSKYWEDFLEEVTLINGISIYNGIFKGVREEVGEEE